MLEASLFWVLFWWLFGRLGGVYNKISGLAFIFLLNHTYIMPQPQDKQTLMASAQGDYEALMAAIETADADALAAPFVVGDKPAKCATFQQGTDVKDLLVHAFEWQRLQSAFVANIRKGEPKDFIPDPYRKDYKEMDRVNFEKHRSTSLASALAMLRESHAEMMRLMESFTEEELMGKKVFRVTYTTTMAAYFMSVTSQPYTQSLKKLKSHLRDMKKLKKI